MTAPPPNDPIVALWQTAPKPDKRLLLQDLQSANQAHRRLYQTVIAIVVGFALLIAFEEATGRLETRGALTVVWTLCLVVAFFWHRRTRGEVSEALTGDSVSLLKFMLARAKRGLFIARCLYLSPLAAFVSVIVLKAIGVGGVSQTAATDPWLSAMQTGAGAASLIVMLVAGLVLARLRHRQVGDFSQKLKMAEDGL